MNESIDKVIQWAINRNLHVADPHKQMTKVTEEVGEVAGALARMDKVELEKEIGDVVVTLIILTKQLDMDIESCLEAAYRKIKDRKGKTINGIYIKEEDVNKDNKTCSKCKEGINTEHDMFTVNQNSYTCISCAELLG